MKLNKLTINNFFRYYGKQEIMFSTDDKKNVTVLRGENGSGKTTILNAFYWCMYGDVLSPLTIENMLNYRTFKEMDNGSAKTSSVKLEFEDRGKKYSIERKQRFIKQKDELKTDKNSPPYISYQDNKTGNEKEIDEKDFIESIIPKRLREFFFFDGERINKLAQVDGKEEIRKAILDILGLTTIDNTSKDLVNIKSDYIKDLAKNSNEDEKRLIKELDSKTVELSIHEEVLESHNNNLREAEKEFDRVNKFLDESNSKVVNAKQSERKRIVRELEISKKDLANTKENIANHISKNLKIYLISTYFKDIVDYLEEKRKKGELPSDIKIQFIDDILRRQKCICGCELLPGNERYDTVKRLKSVAGRSELDDAYSKITSYIKYIGNYTKFYSELDKLNRLESEYIDNIDELKDSLNRISTELLKSNEEKIRYNESRRINLNNDIKELNKKIGNTESYIKFTKRDIVKIEDKIKLCAVNNKIASGIKLKIDQVEKLLELNTEIKEYFIDVTRIELDKKIKEVFSRITRKDYRVPVLTPNFELKIISNLRGENVSDSEVLSTGEGQITSLAFIGSLVSYAREKTKEQYLSDFSGGDFPIVMDSPFGNLDAIHTANVARNIGGLASQVIIIVSDKQWGKEVEENIKNQVGKMYTMHDVNDTNKDVLESTIIKEAIYNG